MGLNAREKRLLKKLTSQGLLAPVEIQKTKIPKFKPLKYTQPEVDLGPLTVPKLPKGQTLNAPLNTTQQDFSNYLLTHVSGDKRSASAFGKSLASREGAATEKPGALSRLFDALSTPLYAVTNALDAGLDMAEGEGVGENLLQIGKGIAGAAVKLADDTVLNPAEMLPFGVGDKITKGLKDTEKSLGFGPKDRKLTGQVLEEHGVPTGAFLGLGLMGDIALDPLTYTGVGLGRRLMGGGKSAADTISQRAAVSDPSKFVRGSRPQNVLPNVAEAAVKDPILSMRGGLPKLPKIDIGPAYQAGKEAQDIRFAPKTRRLKRKLDKARVEGAGGVTKGQLAGARTDENFVDPDKFLRGLKEKMERANKDWERAMLQSGKVVEKGNKMSVRAANEIASNIAAGRIPRAVPVTRAVGPVAEQAGKIADDFIDTLKGPKRATSGRFMPRNLVKEVRPSQQLVLMKNIMAEIGPNSDELPGVLKAAEDKLIALGVQPVNHDGLRVRLSDYLHSMQVADPKRFKEDFAGVLNDFSTMNMKKVHPDARAVLTGLAAQRSMNMSDLVSTLSKQTMESKKFIENTYSPSVRRNAEGQVIKSAVQHALDKGATNKEARAIRDLIKDHIDTDRMPADKWLEASANALRAAVDKGIADPALQIKFQKMVAESMGVTTKNMNTKITGNPTLNTIMGAFATWWGKGNLWRDAQKMIEWGDSNAKWRAATARSFVRNYSKDERQAAWKIVVGAAPAATASERELRMVNFINDYFGVVLRNAQHGTRMDNATTRNLSVAEKSGMLRDDLNKELKQIHGVKAFQFSNRSLERSKLGVTGAFDQGAEWMESWRMATPDDWVDFVYDIDIAIERVTKKYAVLDNFAAEFGTLTKDANHTFQMNHSRIKGVMVPPEVGRAMNNVIKDLETAQWAPRTPLTQFYRKALKTWKSGVTIYLPSHHVRNGIGDMYLMWLAGHNDVRAFSRAARIMASQRTRYQAARKAGDMDTTAILTDPQAAEIAATTGKEVILNVKGTKVTADQLYVGAYQRGLLPTVNDLEDIFGETTFKIFERSPFKGQIHNAAAHASEYRDHYIRLSHFNAAVNKNLKAGKSLEKAMDEAGFEVRKWHPDGRDMTNFEQKWMRNIVPFYSWLRKSTPLLLESLMVRPAKHMVYPRGMVELQNALGIDASLLDPYPDDQLFPEWIRESGIGPIGDPESEDNSIARWFGNLGRNVITPSGTTAGYTVVNPGNPFIDAGRQFLGHGIKDTGAGLLESITPFAKIPIDLTKNSDFTGAPITKDEGGQGVLRYLATQMPGIGPVQRVTDIGNKKREDVEERPLDYDAVLNMLLASGIIGTGPYEKGAEFEAKERAKRLREKLNGN